MKGKLSIILSIAGLYLISTGLSFAAFNFILGKEGSIGITSPVAKVSPSPKVKYKVDPSLPRDQECPLDGVKYTKKEKEVWDSRRPLAVMVENSDEARPHSGISRADITYEALAEGWITRLMAIFYCNTPYENITIAPVRSARTYFVDWVSEYDALYTHVGGANTIGGNSEITDPRVDALSQIDRYGIKDMDQFGIGYPDCYRNPDRLDHPVATEHTMVCFSDNLYKIGEKRGWTNIDRKGISWDKNFTKWSFKEDAKEADRGTVNSVKLVFSEGYDKYDVLWEYDKTNNLYKRINGGIPHIDLETKEQLTAKNVVVQLTKLVGAVDDLGHLLFITIGSGKALVFQDGEVTVGIWIKKTRISKTMYYDATGQEIKFNRGNVWIEIIPNEKQITY